MFRAAAVAMILLSVVCVAPAGGVVDAVAPEIGPGDSDADSVETRSFQTDDHASRRAAGAASPTIEIDTELSLTPEEPGSIGVVQTFDNPEEVTALRVTLDPESTVSDTDGFSHVEGQTWEWDGETEAPVLRYDMAANQTTDREGPMGADGSYLYADVGEWALVQQPNVGLQWRYRGDDSVAVDRAVSVDGEGAVGDATAFLGPHEVYTRDVADQEIRLIVPTDAELADSPERILDGLANASRELQIGDRDSTVFAVAAPTDRVNWAVQGLQIGDTDFWTRANQPIDGVGSTWLHEYVHTRQSFRTADSGRWVTEATATWYAVLLSHQLEGASFDAFSRFLERGSASPQANSVLADPADWANNANYWKGALVSGEIDRQLRLSTDGGSTLQRVLARLNDRSEAITNADIVAAVVAVGSDSTGDTAERLTTTDDAPAMWDSETHREAFGGDAALLRVHFDSASDVRATGPYRNASVQPTVRLATGETLAVRTTVENLGTATGDYAVTMRVDDDTVAGANRTLDPDQRTTATLTHRFDEPGRYVVSVAGEQFTVAVREPATPRVDDVTVEPTTVARGDDVTVTATVVNDESVPGNATVSFMRDDETVTNETVTVGPGERETVTATIEMDESGDRQVGVDGQVVDVRVEPRTTTTSTTSPGFGASGGLAAIGVALTAAGLCRRRSGE